MGGHWASPQNCRDLGKRLGGGSRGPGNWNIKHTLTMIVRREQDHERLLPPYRVDFLLSTHG